MKLVNVNIMDMEVFLKAISDKLKEWWEYLKIKIKLENIKFIWKIEDLSID